MKKNELITSSNSLKVFEQQISIGEKLLVDYNGYNYLVILNGNSFAILNEIDVSIKEIKYLCKFDSQVSDSSIFFFTNTGLFFSITYLELLKLFKNKTIKLKDIFNINEKDDIVSVISINQIDNNFCFVFGTQNGLAKKTKITEFNNNVKKGTIAIKLKNDDRLIQAFLSKNPLDQIMIISTSKAVRFESKKIKSMSRNSFGLTGMKLLLEGDVVKNILCVTNPTLDHLIVVTEKGYLKRTNIDDPLDNEAIYRITNRGGFGVKTISITEKTGSIIKACTIRDKETLFIVGKNGSKIIKDDKIPLLGRATTGLKRINNTVLNAFVI